MKKEFEELYNNITDAGRELKVIHGGVVEVAYQPVPSVRDNTLTDNPFIRLLPQPEAPVEQEAPEPTQEDTQVYSLCSQS